MSLDWVKSKVAVKVLDGQGNEHVIELQNKITITTEQQFERIHGFGEGEFNRGVTRKVPVYTWSLTLPANSKSVRVFRTLMVSKESTKIFVADSQGAGTVNEFKLISETLSGCRVTSMDQSYEIAALPMITFAGIALSHEFVSVDADGNTYVPVDTVAVTFPTIATVVQDKTFGNGYAETDATMAETLLKDVWNTK